MAIEISIVPEVSPIVTALATQVANQHKFVQIGPLGVSLANVGSASGTGAFVLRNAPAAGEVCTLAVGPNVSRVIAGEAIVLGQLVQVMSATGLAGVGNVTSVGLVAGQAWSTAAGSGEFVSVKLK